MIRHLLTGLVLLVSLWINGQTVVFYEDFENSSALLMSSSGTPGWTISTQLAATGLRSDSASCINPGDSSVLVTTNNVNTTGFGYVMLEFDHIAKIEFYDGGYIEVSGDGGQTWNRLTGQQYLGAGQFATIGNKFNSTSYLDWLPGNPSPPSNTWWKHEYFDISAFAANSASVLVRFILKDENNQSLFDNYAWFLDNIRITAALSELTPPAIALVPPVFQGFKFTLGPFPISASITDTSGVDTAWVVYRVNHGSWDSLPMQPGANNIFVANIPQVNDLDTIDYYIIAVDASVSSNVGTYPATGHITIIASSGLYTPYFNDFEITDSLWVSSTTSSATRWEYGPPNYGLLTGAFSGTAAWTINKDSLYGNSATATLTSPYFNFYQAEDLVLSFWQNRNTETTWDGIHLEYTLDEVTWTVLGGLNDPDGENWYNDTIYATAGSPAWTGTSGGWIKSSYRLSFLNNTPMVRFRFVFNSDPFVTFEGVSIDDFSIQSRPDVDIALKAISSPMTGCNPGMEPVTVEIRNEGKDTLYSVPLNYQVAGALQPVSQVFNDTLFPDSTLVFTFSTMINMNVTGKDSIFSMVIYASHPADSVSYNDTLYHDVIAGSIPNDPTITYQTIPYGTSTKLTAVSGDTLFWFNDPNTSMPLHIGDTLQTPLLFDSTTYYVEARTGIGKLRFTELTFESAGAGCSNPYPPYIPPTTQWDGVEITNTGSSSIDLSGFIFHMEGFKQIDYPLPDGVVLMPGELVILSIYSSPVIQPDTANRFYIAGNQSIFANSQVGFWLEAPDGSVEDALAVNGYNFTPGSPVTQADWSGAIPIGTGKAGVIRVFSDSNTATDWVLSGLPSPIQTIGAYNPQLDPVTSLGCPGNRLPVKVFMNAYPPSDAGIVSILEPATASGLTANEPVKVVVRNFGTQQISSIPVAFNVNGSAPVFETINATVPSGDTVHYTFSNSADLSAFQYYNIKAWTDLQNDTVPLNDTVAIMISNLLPSYCTSTANWTSLGDVGLVEFGPLVSYSATGVKTYTDYTHLPPESFIQGLTYPISVTMQSQSTYNYVYGVKVFIDFNGDGVFDPATETVLSGLTSSTNTVVSGNVAIPYNSVTGFARMRVVGMYTSNLSLVLPCGTYNYGETEDYTILILPRLEFDAGITAMSGFNPPLIEGSQISLSAWIKNLGSDTLTQIAAGWTIQGQGSFIDTINTTLASGDSILHSFSVPVSIPYGVFQLKVFSDLQNDQFRGNDTLKATYLGEKDFTILFFDDFEHDDLNGWYPEMTALWQHGKPAALVINNAYSPTRVWATRLTGNYLNNVQKGLISPEFNFSGFSGVALRFWHWYETEYGFDGGTVKYSDNSGNTFITLGYIGDPLGVNWYNANASGKFAFSGHSGGWVYSSYDLSAFDNHSTPVKFMFEFFSNLSVTFNGWAIDDFMITVEKANIDAGISHIILPVLTVPQGSSFNVVVRIENFGKSVLNSIPIAFTINGGIEYQDVWTGVLQPGATVDYTFSTSAISPGYMELKAYTKLPGDDYFFNDAATRTVGHVGIHNPDITMTLSVTPNPASENVWISMTLPQASDASMVMYDMSGRMVISKDFIWAEGENREEISLEGLKPGAYQMVVNSRFGKSYARILVIK